MLTGAPGPPGIPTRLRAPDGTWAVAKHTPVEYAWGHGRDTPERAWDASECPAEQPGAPRPVPALHHGPNHAGAGGPGQAGAGAPPLGPRPAPHCPPCWPAGGSPASPLPLEGLPPGYAAPGSNSCLPRTCALLAPVAQSSEAANRLHAHRVGGDQASTSGAQVGRPLALPARALPRVCVPTPPSASRLPRCSPALPWLPGRDMGPGPCRPHASHTA